jgi:DNA-binding protein H-NS
MTNLDTLSLAELKQLQKDVTKLIAGFDDRKKSEARAMLEAQAKEMGYTLAELAGMPATRKRTEAKPKYSHPESADVTWSGRGRKPHWFNAHLAAGHLPESLEI